MNFILYSAKKDVNLNNILAAEVILLNALQMDLVVLFVFYTVTTQIQLARSSHHRVPLI